MARKLVALSLGFIMGGAASMVAAAQPEPADAGTYVYAQEATAPAAPAAPKSAKPEKGEKPEKTPRPAMAPMARAFAMAGASGSYLGIDIQDVSGRTRFETVNGGVTLSNVSGDMRGRTVNGGLNVRLDGQRWEGAGLDVETTNGGVRMSMPEGYNAELTAETSNGGLVVDFPITVQGRIAGVNHRISTTLGSGGPRLQVRTVNGGVTIARR